MILRELEKVSEQKKKKVSKQEFRYYDILEKTFM